MLCLSGYKLLLLGSTVPVWSILNLYSFQEVFVSADSNIKMLLYRLQENIATLYTYMKRSYLTGREFRPQNWYWLVLVGCSQLLVSPLYHSAQWSHGGWPTTKIILVKPSCSCHSNLATIIVIHITVIIRLYKSGILTSKFKFTMMTSIRIPVCS